PSRIAPPHTSHAYDIFSYSAIEIRPSRINFVISDIETPVASLSSPIVHFRFSLKYFRHFSYCASVSRWQTGQTLRILFCIRRPHFGQLVTFSVMKGPPSIAFPLVVHQLYCTSPILYIRPCCYNSDKSTNIMRGGVSVAYQPTTPLMIQSDMTV